VGGTSEPKHGFLARDAHTPPLARPLPRPDGREILSPTASRRVCRVFRGPRPAEKVGKITLAEFVRDAVAQLLSEIFVNVRPIGGGGHVTAVSRNNGEFTRVSTAGFVSTCMMRLVCQPRGGWGQEGPTSISTSIRGNKGFDCSLQCDISRSFFSGLGARSFAAARLIFSISRCRLPTLNQNGRSWAEAIWTRETHCVRGSF